jgi:cell division septation protein DedD
MALDQAHRYGHRRMFATPSRRRRMRGWVVVGLFLGFVALAWAWAFQRGPSQHGSDVPILIAGAQPTREKPTDPGGLKVADIDPLSYDSGRSPPRVENILPAPEKPLPQPVPEQRAATGTVAPTAATAGAATPVKVADQAVAPSQKLVPDQVMPATNPATNAVAAVVPGVARAGSAEPSLKRPTDRDETKRKPMTPTAGGYRLQLASLRSTGDAREVEAKLKRSYGDVLGSVSFSIVAVNLVDRGLYYRVMAGPMSQNSASQICNALRQRGAACIIARP